MFIAAYKAYTVHVNEAVVFPVEVRVTETFRWRNVLKAFQCRLARNLAEKVSPSINILCQGIPIVAIDFPRTYILALYYTEVSMST